MKPFFAILLVTLAWMNAEGFERTPLGDSIDRATLKVLKEAYLEDKEKNVITSPLGVFLLLSLYSNGASPGSRQEIDNFLGGGDHKQLTESYSGLSNEFAEMDPNYLTLANKIYVTERFKLNDAFADVVRSYSSEVDKIDFFDNQKAADVINAWAAEKTQGHITSPISASDIRADTVISLLNVIFFEGEWAVPFDISKTQYKDFFVNKDTMTKKPSMTLLDWLPYAKSEDLGASLIELRYKEDGFRMVVVLPDEVDGLPSVLEKAAVKGLLEDVFKLENIRLDLTIPKFEIRNKLDFKNILPKVGISKVFEESTVGIVKDESAIVNKIFQEAYVKVDEKGAVATAVSGMFASSRMSAVEIPPPLVIKVDHPFLFYIQHNDKVLFAGTYTH